MNRHTPDRENRGKKKLATDVASSEAGPSSSVPPSPATASLEVPASAGPTTRPSPRVVKPRAGNEPEKDLIDQHLVRHETTDASEEQCLNPEYIFTRPHQFTSSSFDLSHQLPTRQDTEIAGRTSYFISKLPPLPPSRSPSLKRRKRILNLNVNDRVSLSPPPATTPPNAGQQQSTPTSGRPELPPTESSSSPGVLSGSRVSSNPLPRSTPRPLPNVGKCTIFSKRRVDEFETEPVQSPTKRHSSGHVLGSMLDAGRASLSQTSLVNYSPSDEGDNASSQEVEAAESTHVAMSTTVVSPPSSCVLKF